MGLSSSVADVSHNLKAQAGALSGNWPLYKLIGLSGDGELVQATRLAMKNKNFDELDEAILTHLPKYLYNEGLGKQLPIQKLVQYRIKEEGNVIMAALPKFNNPDIKHEEANTETGVQSRQVCFSLEHRGSVGETLLHLCFINGSFIHRELARRIIHIYPAVVNDIYLSNDFYGESCLHIAIMNEDIEMVRVLLKHGANVHQRCTGRFFCPDDQKFKLRNTIHKEHPIFPVETNYQGFLYFGELPLTFAALVNQLDIVQELIRHGAKMNKTDSNGNTVLHMLVIHNNLEMFKHLGRNRSLLKLRNNQGLTPMTLAAKFGHKEMFTYITTLERKPYWVYADIACAAYKLDNLDTIEDSGKIDVNSALNLIVNGETENHLDMIDGFVIDLLNNKWKNFAQLKFYSELALFVILYALNSTALLFRRQYHDYLLSHYQNYTDSFTNKTINCFTHVKSEPRALKRQCYCLYLYPEDPDRLIRATLDAICFIYGLFFLIQKVTELHRQGFMFTWFYLQRSITKLLFILSLVCMVLIVPIKFFCWVQIEDYLVVLSILLMSMCVFQFGKPFKDLGTLICIFEKIVTRDLSRFLAIYAIFLCGFSQGMPKDLKENQPLSNRLLAFYLAFQMFDFDPKNYDDPNVHPIFTTPILSFLDVFVLSTADLDTIDQVIKLIPYTYLAQVLLVLFLILVFLILLNLLIAMMANTYEATKEVKREWIRQWARIVLSIEQNLSKKQRIKEKQKYTHLMRNDEKAFIVRWKQTDNERVDHKKTLDLFWNSIKNVKGKQ